jgi:hypothetical protein
MKSAALLLLAWAAIDAGRDRWKVDFKLSLVEKEGRWTFMVDGTTDLPAGTVLSARVYVLDVVDDPKQGRVEDDSEPLVGKDDALQSEYRYFKVKDGAFHERVHTFRRKPYSISYRAKIQYSPDDQTDALALKVGDASFVHAADLRVGTDADYAEELRDRGREMGKELMRLEALGSELGDWIARPAPAPAEWKTWKDAASSEIAALQDKNEERFKVWAVWAEYQGRMRIDGLSGFLDRMIAAADDPKGNAKQIRVWLPAFVDSIDEAYTAIGFEPPLDGRKAGPLLAAYERVVIPVLEGRADLSRKARAEGISALFDLLGMLRSRPRGYAYVNAVGLEMTRAMEMVDDHASVPELQQALARHKAALGDLRKFAGIP